MWETPKTNWTSGDTFDVTDYNRIKGNIDELKALSHCGLICRMKIMWTWDRIKPMPINPFMRMRSIIWRQI